MRLYSLVAICLIGISAAGCAARAAAPDAGGAPPSADPWPRVLQLPDASARVYQPQVESWQGNQLQFRSAVGILPSGEDDTVFGVVWGSALTQVDRTTRRVTLSNLTLTRSNFPTQADGGAHYQSELQAQLPAAMQTIALDRLQASLAASGAYQPAGVAVNNAAPNIIVSYAPAVLVPIDGKAVWQPVSGTGVERVINTRALIARPRGSATVYLHIYDGWMSAGSVDGPWSVASSPPASLTAAAQSLSANSRVDLLAGSGAPSLASGAPAVYVVHQPSELIVFKGQPNLQPIASTGLLWARNTTSDVLVDTASNTYYVLLSGRWYSAAGLSGPWTFVPSNALPASFASIPAGSPAGVVLAAVAGTPQAREAVIENSIPQTAAVPRSGGPTFTATYAGKPQWQPIAGTPLSYAENAPTPIIKIDANTYYALRAGVWFSATSPQGPWVVAATVPDIVYTIPPTSPMYYVTYVRVYDATPEVVYVGYTPGYLGTVVTPDGTVVYGTGYEYESYVGDDVWYAAPDTWGMAAQPVYNPAMGYGYGFALGLTSAAMVDSWSEPVYYDTVYRGYPCCGSASANVYGHWGNVVSSGTDTWYDNSSGTYGEKSSGTYTNTRTGTTGTYSDNRSVNPYTGQAQKNVQGSYDTTAGGSGNVDRNERYDAQTGQYTTSSSGSATGAGGSTVTHDSSTSTGPQGDSASRSTTVDNANTGTTKTYSSGYNGDDHYADANGNTYTNDGSGWQSSSGNTPAASDNSWADREQQARSSADNRFGAFQNGGWANRFGGGGDAGGGGGFGGDRFGGGGGGFGDRFGGGGFGDRFGEGGFHGGGFRR